MFAEILLPQKIGFEKETLTYAIPENLEIKPGDIMEVPLMKRKIRGIVLSIHNKKPGFSTKHILRKVDSAPHLSSWQIKLLQWISEYYFCPLFKSLKLFLPQVFLQKKNLQQKNPCSEEKQYVLPELKLNSQQKEVLLKIQQNRKSVSVLHGITASGKTQIYLQLALDTIKKGEQILILVPEISLTPQTVQRFEEYFSGNIAILHSQITSQQKQQAWMNIYQNKAKIIIGSRSALFAPFQSLGYIIIDEEHDHSYKQDQSPRYHAVNVALKIAELLNIKVILGSATPSLESYYNAKHEKYQLVELTQRVGNNKELPKTTIVDLRQEIQKRNFSIFSELLQKKLQEKLGNHEQSLLFLNRRGAASAVLCRACGSTVRCQNCDLSLTYHKKIWVEGSIFETERLICHQCGKIEKVPSLCPNCKSSYIRYIGLGTQRIEEELSKILPLARILRADRDTVQKRNAFQLIYENMKNHQSDIIIGTQMIAFGLHLPKVNLVGVILADLGLTLPGFNSSEKTFQLIMQVAGRSGRSKDQGEVIIQTYLPNHYAIAKAAKHDYKGFYDIEIQLREKLSYPPFTKLIKLTIINKNAEACHEKTKTIYQALEKLNEGQNTISCYPALIPKLNNLYRWHILLNGKNPEHIVKLAKNILSQSKETIKIDVDPISSV